MTIADKVAESLKVIRAAYSNAKAPCVLSSFGKDSMVMLWLLRLAGLKMPVMFFRQPYVQKKYLWAYQVAAGWDLDLYDLPPKSTVVQQRGEHLSVVCKYDIAGTTIDLPVDFYSPKEGEKCVCGLTDIYGRATGASNFNADLILCGHKSSDQDDLYGKIPLKADVAMFPDSPSVVYPLRHWTDADIWEATELYGIPYDTERYEKTEKGWGEKEDKTLNSDYLPGCVACMVKDGGVVQCPKMGLEVSNAAQYLRWQGQQSFSYMEFKP